MGITGIVVMWILAAIVYVIINSDRYGKEVKQREGYWSRFL